MHLRVAALDDIGVLRRIAGLYESRRYQVLSLSTGPTEEPGIVGINLKLDETPERAERLCRQLRRLFDVLEVTAYYEDDLVCRELALIQIIPGPEVTREQILEITAEFDGRPVGSDPESLVVEATGEPGQLDLLVAKLSELGALTVSRTGSVAVPKNAGNSPGKPKEENHGNYFLRSTC
ncbi:MAG: acetolactate synthase small subunit [Thermaerobacterales bacterium]